MTDVYACWRNSEYVWTAAISVNIDLIREFYVVMKEISSFSLR